jgi:hypothetical protein
MALRVAPEVEAAGLDQTMHGAPGYLFGTPTHLEHRPGGGFVQVVQSPD